jgi:hypothetical protein
LVRKEKFGDVNKMDYFCVNKIKNKMNQNNELHFEPVYDEAHDKMGIVVKLLILFATIGGAILIYFLTH